MYIWLPGIFELFALSDYTDIDLVVDVGELDADFKDRIFGEYIFGDYVLATVSGAFETFSFYEFVDGFLVFVYLRFHQLEVVVSL